MSRTEQTGGPSGAAPESGTPPPAKKRRRRKPRPAPPPPAWSECVYLRVAPAYLARLKFLLEAHDNLGLLTVVDRRTAVARFVFSPHFRAEALAFLREAAELAPHEIVLEP